METLGLKETLEALRADLEEAMADAAGRNIQFPVKGVEIEFQVGVTKSAEAKTGVKFWVFELGVGGEYAKESVHKLTVSLDAPVDHEGKPIKVTRSTSRKP
jgi:Trypsin-co-occurring domain 2